MVIALQTFLKLIDARKGNILLFAQGCMTDSQFIAYRKFVLNQLGDRGLAGDLKKISSGESNGVIQGNGQEYTTQERGCSNE